MNNSLHCPYFSGFAKARGQMLAWKMMFRNRLRPDTDTPLPVQMTEIMPCRDTARNGSTEPDPGFASRQGANLQEHPGRALTPTPTLPGVLGHSSPTVSPSKVHMDVAVSETGGAVTALLRSLERWFYSLTSRHCLASAQVPCPHPPLSGVILQEPHKPTCLLMCTAHTYLSHTHDSHSHTPTPCPTP